MIFDLCIGIDYSGAKTPITRSSALQVYAADNGALPQPVASPSATDRAMRHWCRKEIAGWLIEQARADRRFIAGIDHGFSFPISYFQRYQLRSWHDFLSDFCRHWPTDRDDVQVDAIRNQSGGQLPRTGAGKELRLTEQWSSSAKSVFQFDMQGSVAKSTHTGIPWLQRIGQEVGDRLHFWPFDGWSVPPGKSVIAEVYPSIFRNRYPREDRSCDQQDAYAVARWLSETVDRGFLDRYFAPPLTDQEQATANLEGWILGIT